MIVISFLLAALINTKADVPRVTASELRALLDKGEAVAIDVRGTVPYELGHIAGAVWMPLGVMNQRVGELPQDKLLVMYCTCKAEELSLEAAMLLAQKHGLERVAVLVGGYPAWKDAGYPIKVLQQPDPPQVDTPAAKPAETVATVYFDETSQGSSGGRGSGSRLAPPEAVKCDRNDLTSHAGRVTSYKREKERTVLVMATSAGTIETVVVKHGGKRDASSLYLIEGQPFTAADWKRIERRKGVLLPDVSAIAWVCGNGVNVIDWRPGATFTGAE